MSCVTSCGEASHENVTVLVPGVLCSMLQAVSPLMPQA